jgi:hypothetical protein
MKIHFKKNLENLILLFLIFVIVACSAFTILYVFIGFKIAFFYELMLALANFIWLITLRNASYKEMRISARLYLNLMTVLLYPLLLINYKTGPPTSLMYYLLIPLGMLLFDKRKNLWILIVKNVHRYSHLRL